MFLPIREGIAEVLRELEQLRKDTEHTEGWAESFGNQLGKALVREMKLAWAQSFQSVRDDGCQTAPQIVVSSTPELRKRPRELTVSQQDTAAKKTEMKRPKASPREEEWMKVPARKSLQMKKPKPESKKPEWPRRARPEAVLIKPTEGVSYAAILKYLKKHVKPDELGVTVHGIWETRSKDLLVELKFSKKGRGRLDTALREVIGASRTVRHLIPRIEVKIADIEASIEAEDVENAVRGFFDHASELELKVSLTKRPSPGNRKAYVLLEKARALKLLKVTYIKIGWVSCRVRQKMKINRSYRCLGFGHMAANCRGPDRSRSCCFAKEDKPRDDHIPGTIRCTAFR